MKKLFLIIGTILFFVIPSKASHIFGGEFTYEFISGNTYRFNLTLYGDCGTTNPNLLTNLLSCQPYINRYNNNILIDSFTLALVPGSGIEVSPVCPAQLGNTICTNTSSTIPGVRQYKYTGTKNLGSTSANWRFMFWGNLNFNNNQTGRSSSLTNVGGSLCGSGSGFSVMAFEATLNNLNVTNSSVSYTTIPTPFQCVNKPQSYNQGAVDPDLDSLSFALVDGIDGASHTYPYCFAQYNAGYSGANPLSSVAGTFNFNTSTGQLNYTPNILQNSLVVAKVTEYRNGIIVGTTMREMAFVVLNCNNNPPGGGISNVNVGYVDSLTNIYVCQNASNLNFTIPVVDIDGDSINVTYSGLPAGCTLSIAGNNTPTPTITGNYAPSGGYVIGNYTFFVTYQDYGCPLVSKQTIAYTIHVLPAPNIVTTVTQPTCANGGVGTILGTASGGTPTYTYALGSGAASANNLFTNVAPGNYIVKVIDAKGCTRTANVNLISPPLPTINNIAKTFATCDPGCDATITISATTPSGTAISYSNNNGGTYQSSNSFASMCVGTYTIIVKDANNCSASSTVIITNPASPTVNNLQNTLASCAPGCDGTITNISGFSATGGPYSYSLNGGIYQTTNSFSNLCVGPYIVSIKDAAGCTGTSAVTISNPAGPTISFVTSVNASCSPGCDGQLINITATSTAGGIQYKLNVSGTYQNANSFNGLCSGSYTIITKDANGCTNSTVANVITQPNPIINSLIIQKASCVPGCDGSIVVNATASSGASLVYAYNGGSNQTNATFGALCVGIYTIVVTDSKACTASTIGNVLKEPDPVISASSSKNISCNGAGDGSINVTATGNGTITYFLTPANTTNTTGTFTNLQANGYTVLITDSKGCNIQQFYTILEPGILDFDTVIKKDKTCEFNNNGYIAINIIGGTNPMTFNLNNGSAINNSGVFSNLNSGLYTIAVIDANGCSIATNINILPPVNPMQIVTTYQEIQCNGNSTDGWAEVVASQGASPYSYLWNTEPATTTPRVEGLYAGTFIITVADANGCINKDTVLLRDPSYCCTNLYVPNAFSPNQDGINDNLKIFTDTKILNPIMQVYDRWGNKVYETEDITNSWKGEYSNGQLGEMGIYFYLLKYKCAVNDKDYVKKGDILLVK